MVGWARELSPLLGKTGRRKMQEDLTQARVCPLAPAASRIWTSGLQGSADERSPRRSVDADYAVAVGAAERHDAKAGMRADDEFNHATAFVGDFDG